MENIVHFGHEHPLIFKEYDELMPYCCNACGLYLLSSPSYSCTIQDCSFHLHQACTQLPRKSHHYFIGTHVIFKHDLALLAKPHDDNCLCGECGKLCKNFTYHCSECELVLHSLCGFSLDIQTKHVSHPQHPMKAICKEALLLCDICGRKHNGYFFSCHRCNFWIHQDCALLPTFVTVEKHDHHLSLLYSTASLEPAYMQETKCLICGESMAIKRSGLYFCFTCSVMAHVDCAASWIQDSGAILHLPIMLDDIFPSLIMRTGVEEKAIQESNSKSILEKYHNHSLVLIDDTWEESVCNACILPISPPYYKCSAQSECNFLLHKFCSDLPLSIKDSFHNSLTRSLASSSLDEFFSLFRCIRCLMFCNGFGYSRNKIFATDLECALAPRVIKHDSHKQHPLILVSHGLLELSQSCCGGKHCYKYNCSVCNFNIHIQCALLPKTVTHKFDKHPLTLIFSSSSQHHSYGIDHFCEFCEGDINPKYWFYHCAKCDQSFHVNCIPSLGEYSKIKFGGVVKVPCHDDHPLTLVRMLSVGNQTCGYCQNIIEGFKDGMALHCAICDFWIHFKCGYRSCGANASFPYLDLDHLPN